MRPSHIPLMASYNSWMNTRLYEAAGRLPSEVLTANHGAFFGSLLGTLNHLVVADTMWLRRFAGAPAARPALAAVAELPHPQALNEILFADLPPLWSCRQHLDALITAWAGELTDTDLDQPLSYRNSRGEAQRRRLGDLLLHFFNHQTHHRGQATTLLSQAGVDYGVTDLLALIPQVPDTAP